MSSTQTMASGDKLTLISNTAGALITQRQADTWLRQRQATSAATAIAPATMGHRVAS